MYYIHTSLQVNLGGASSSEGAVDLSHAVASVFVTAHRSVVEMSERMLFEMKRHNYVTPTNYLELVTGYKRSGSGLREPQIDCAIS